MNNNYVIDNTNSRLVKFRVSNGNWIEWIPIWSVLCSHTDTSDQQNRTTGKWESDLLITSMITDRIRRHKVLLPVDHKYNNLSKM